MPYVVFIAAPDFDTLKAMHKAVVDAGITTKQLTVSWHPLTFLCPQTHTHTHSWWCDYVTNIKPNRQMLLKILRKNNGLHLQRRKATQITHFHSFTHSLFIFPPVVSDPFISFSSHVSVWRNLYSLYPHLIHLLCVGRTWTWGRQWTRAPASRGLTATTLTSLSSTTTWTKPLRCYRLPWTNSAVNPSGSRWTGCTKDQQQCSRCPLWVGHTDPPACEFLTTKAKEEEKRAEIFQQNNIIKKKKISYRSLSRLGPARRATVFLLKTQRERVLIYFITFYEKSFYLMCDSTEN